MTDSWKQFSAPKDYRLVDLGRPAVFLLPANKLRKKIGADTVENKLHAFLIKNFSSYTTSLIVNFGFWKNDREKLIYDQCREYEVSFVGKEKIPKLLKKLSLVAAEIGEDCIYFKAGQYACLIYPQIKK